MFSVEVQDLGETIDALREVDAGMASALKSEIRRIAQPTLEKARGYAASLGSSPSGSYARSLAMRTRQSGVVLQSGDPGGGVIEFANTGAVILTGERRGRRAPVPHGSQPPRALLRSVLEDEESIVEALNSAVARFVDGVM